MNSDSVSIDKPDTSSSSPFSAEPNASSQASPARGEVVDRRGSASLVERLDPALGEAASGIGAILNEFVRQTLRGGIQKVDEELQSQVDDKVDQTVADRMPQIEDHAAKTAESTAREVADSRVESLEHDVKETTDRLADDIAQTDRKAETAAEKLADDLVVTETRIKSAANEMIEELRNRSKGTAEMFNQRIVDLQQRAATIEQNLQTRAVALEQALQDRFDSLQNEMSQSVEACRHQLQAEKTELLGEISSLTGRNQTLEARLAELEKPRGLRKWLGKLMPWRKKRSTPSS